ncbi:hypothetical protein [Streptomyces fulvoviolaceus]|uniref:hypothetical protein n=1 Tax=Streptomyces fulvoviolaceus TaxID=285535 RepID=UPI0021BE212A|nr:hypothetical protein [Streptomyces fulvoviolaceus]MCT9077555.1 hypothetical protein [Streptomyces fulvoviolaceus]
MRRTPALATLGLAAALLTTPLPAQASAEHHSTSTDSEDGDLILALLKTAGAMGNSPPRGGSSGPRCRRCSTR